MLCVCVPACACVRVRVLDPWVTLSAPQLYSACFDPERLYRTHTATESWVNSNAYRHFQ